MTESAIYDPDDDDSIGWRGPGKFHTNPLGSLTARLERIERLIYSLQRGAPMASAGVEVETTGLTVTSSLGVTGTTTLGTSTSIAGVGMDTFIPQQQDIRDEVIAARGAWDTLGIRLGQISSIANAVQSEVETARGGQANLNARLNAIAGSIPSLSSLESRMTDAENAITTGFNTTANALNAILGYLQNVRNALIDAGHDPGGVPSPPPP